jgi:hypothetical protein
MQRHDFRILRETLLGELHDTGIMVHAGDGEPDAFTPAAIDQPDRQIAAPGAKIEHRPRSLGVAAHPREHMTAQQTVAWRQDAIDPPKLPQGISQQLL